MHACILYLTNTDNDNDGSVDEDCYTVAQTACEAAPLESLPFFVDLYFCLDLLFIALTNKVAGATRELTTCWPL